MRCFRCMNVVEDNTEICSQCGYDMESKPEVLYHLYPGTVLQNRYEIGVVIGAGGFGVTYKAWDRQLDAIVAVKEYYPAGLVTRVPGEQEVIIYSGRGRQEYAVGLERFLDEAQKMAKFSSHENVVNAYNFFEENNTAYIVMEYLDGVSFKDFLIANGGRTTISYAEEVSLSVAKALRALHDEHIIHRDISPDNIFLLTNGKIKLIDFGAAKLSITGEQSQFITLKPGYAPPEQYRQNGNQGPWTDIYALGATLYRAITGYVPEESSNRTVDDTLRNPKDIVIDLPEHINTTIMRSMALDIEYRFQTIEEFEDALTNKKQVLALEDEIKRRKRNRRRSLIASVMILLLAGLLIGYQFVTMKNGKALDVDLDIWICADEGEDVDALETYYSTVSGEVYGKDYTGVDFRIKVIPMDEYEATLLNAFIQGDAPEIFESTYFSEDMIQHAQELDDLIDNILEVEDGSGYYFLSDYRNYVPDGKRLPIGFSIPVAFSIRRNYQSTIQEDDVKNKAVYLSNHNTEDSITMLTTGHCVYLIGNTTDYDKVQKQIYGTYEEQKEDIAGKLNISLIEDAKPEFTTMFSVSESCNRQEKQAAYLYLQYLVSYQEQYLLHASGSKEGVDESTAFSINKKMDEEYRNKLKSIFSILNDAINQL